MTITLRDKAADSSPLQGRFLFACDNDRDSNAATIEAAFDEAGIYVFRTGHKPIVARAWTDHVEIHPQQLADFMTEGLEDFNTHIELALSSATGELEFEIRAICKTKANVLKASRIFKPQDKTMSGGWLVNKTGNKSIARPLLRKIYEMGYELGCTRIEAEATQKGCYLWASFFEIDEVNPRYQENMLKRLDKIREHIPSELGDYIEDAINRGDIKAIAAITQQAPHDLNNCDYEYLYEETMHKDAPPPITIGKLILIDTMEKCWKGHLDLDNSEHCARIDKKIDRWKHPELRARADHYETAQNAPTHSMNEWAAE